MFKRFCAMALSALVFAFSLVPAAPAQPAYAPREASVQPAPRPREVHLFLNGDPLVLPRRTGRPTI